MNWNRIHFAKIDSTNNWAKAHVDEFPRDRVTIVSADYQSAGRGRFKRLWMAPENVNLLVTFCFFMPPDRYDIGNIPQVLALAACALAPDLPLAIKWPNDITLQGKKLGGILCETVRLDQEVAVCLGIGLNINMEQKDLDAIDIPATSLLVATGHCLDREVLFTSFATAFCKDLDTFRQQGFAPFLQTYRQRLSVPSSLVIQDGARTIRGTFVGIDSEGGLVLNLENGKFQTVRTGELVVG